MNIDNTKVTTHTPVSPRKAIYSSPRLFTPRQKKRQRSEIRKTQYALSDNQAGRDSEPQIEGNSRRASIPALHQQIASSPTISFSNSHTSIRTSHTYHHVNYLDINSVFPYSNKGYEQGQKTLAEESKQWESFFDPQYTFGSFQYGIGKPPKPYFYQGRWPLDQQDIHSVTPSMTRRKKLQTKTVVGQSPRIPLGHQSNLSFAALPNPTLPNKELLEPHTQILSENDHLQNNSNSQIAILPCPSSNSFPKYKNVENERLWKERLAMLRKIQEEGFSLQMNGTQSDPYGQSGKVTRLHQQLIKTATKIKNEVSVEMSVNDMETRLKEEEVGSVIQTPEMEQSGLFSLDMPISNEDNASLITLDENKPEERSIDEPLETRRKNRTSFVLFAFGFLFPPLWIVGTFYSPSSAKPRTVVSKTIDEKWKKYSRNALCVLLLAFLSSFVLVATLKPKLLGFRNSNEKAYQADRVVFD
ncbi:hypothetical protein A0J61_10023 [Choanephora cucurbitarum]|uniref:Uncharacterized protein n=1 Tax=Choanephora cucurbitarum TaxID=101091 RepID=A0A1C7MYL4_9FUNG|nr:hypothetical protein A0J61_10023 [Choanephora cucurbitarum]